MPNASHKTDSPGLCHLLEALPVEQGLQSFFLPSPFPTLAQADKWNPPTHPLQTAESHALNSQRWCPGSPAGVKFSPLMDGKQFAPGEKKYIWLGGAIKLDESDSFQQERTWLLPLCGNTQSLREASLPSVQIGFYFRNGKKSSCLRLWLCSQKHQDCCFRKIGIPEKCQHK